MDSQFIDVYAGLGFTYGFGGLKADISGSVSGTGKLISKSLFIIFTRQLSILVSLLYFTVLTPSSMS